MFKFLKSDPAKKLQKEYEKTTELAMQAQRNGKIDVYAELSKKAEEIAKKLDQLEKSSH